MVHHFSFSGCGFLGIYHFGVSTCLRQHVPKMLENCKIAGASAGSFVAACLITEASIDDCARYFVDLVHHAQSQPILGPLHPRFKLISELRESMVKVLPDDAYKTASGRLFISLTRYKDLENVIVSEYDSNEQLIEAMLCSSFIPFYCGIIPPTHKGDAYWDGGLSDNQPIFEEPTITVSPFSGEVDICPQDNSANFVHLNMCNSSVQFTEENLHRVSIALFPPNSATMSEIFEQGYDDTLQYLQRNGMINCIDHLSEPAVPNFEREDIQEDEMDTKERTRRKLDEDDFECRECKQKLRKSLFASLPPHLLQVFNSTVASKQSILKYICKGELFQALSKFIAPFMAPADILWVYVTSLISNIPRRKHELEHILKQAYMLCFCFMKNYLYKPCKHNKQWIKTIKCIEDAYSYYYFNNCMDRMMQEQVYQSMDTVLGDDKDSSPNSSAISPNSDVQVTNLGYNQETPNQTDSKEFYSSCSCFLGTETDYMSPHNSAADKPHFEILSDLVRDFFKKEHVQSKNNIQMNKSENMEANNQPYNQMNIPNCEQDSAMIDKPLLERSKSDPLCESTHDKKFRFTPDSVTRNMSENTEADKDQYLSKYKEHNISIDQFMLEKLLGGPLPCSKNDLEIQYDGENHKNNQRKIKETHKEENVYTCGEHGIAVDESLIEMSVFEPLVDCEFDTEHEHISGIPQITNSKTLDGLNNETIFFDCEESHITADKKLLERSPGDQLESSGNVEKICHAKYNTVQNNAQKEQNNQLELSKCDESNDRTSNSKISLNYRNVRTLSIQHYAEDTTKIQNGEEPEYNQEINKSNNIVTQIKSFFSL